MIRVSIPNFRKVEDESERRSYTVFYIEVWMSGRYNAVERRYTEFEELHKQLKKLMVTPEFPPKKMLKWNHKVLEQRKQGLQIYIQTICQTATNNGYIPPVLFDFLELEPYEPGFDSVDHMLQEPVMCSHKPMVRFEEDAFMLDNHKSLLPDTIVPGVHLGLYSTEPEHIVRGRQIMIRKAKLGSQPHFICPTNFIEHVETGKEILFKGLNTDHWCYTITSDGPESLSNMDVSKTTMVKFHSN